MQISSSKYSVLSEFRHNYNRDTSWNVQDPVKTVFIDKYC